MATSSAGETTPYSVTPDLSTFISEGSEFIGRHQWVWDVQMTQFFQLQHWNKIPTEVRVQPHLSITHSLTHTHTGVQWREPLLELTTEQINQLPFGFTKVKKINDVMMTSYSVL